MAEEMGSDAEALVNQAMHVFARLNGFVTPGAQDREAAAAPGPEVGAAPKGAATAEAHAPPEMVQSAELLLPSEPLPEPERHAVAERVLETAARLERDIHDRTPPDALVPPRRPTPAAAGPGVRELFIEHGDSETQVAKDRWVIGRGRHCDLVIDSGKVSREHAVVFKGPEGGWFIEDLGSSNGTWHERERIGRRRIDDGDEYFVCSERIRCALR